MFAEPGAATAALNWYRAIPETLHQWPGTPSIDVPTLFLWGSGDGVVGEAAVKMQRRYLTGPYREQQVDAGHRLVLEQCGAVLGALLAHIAPEREAAGHLGGC
jgi:pimeloyl-ACP methyl ester carboxylesterase